MKKADEYLGSMLCRLLGRNASGIKEAQPDPGNILFIKFWGMGSIILTMPAVKAVRKKFPDAKLYYLTFETNREALEVLGIADEIITISLSNPFRFNIDTLKLIHRLKKIQFDIVYDFEFFTYYSALINRLIKPGFSVGFDNHKNRRGTLFAKTIEFNDHIHTRENFLNLVWGSNISSPSEGEIERGSLQSSFGTEFLLGNKINSAFIIGENITPPFIVINPNASPLAFERRLPPEYFVKMIDMLSQQNNFSIVLTGSKDEYDYVESIYNNLKNKNNVQNTAGKLSVRELFRLINDSECLITNDSGPLHIASALDKPVVAFFGPESPVRYGPLSSRQLVFYRGLECSPCMSISNSKTVNCIYNEPKCMRGFDIDEIISKINEFIKKL